MILIADSGSTKTDWACVPEDRSHRIAFTSQGYNPNYISQKEMCEDVLRSLPDGFPREEVREIYFYGAGVTELQYEFVRSTLCTVFPSATEIFVAMDLLAAARALLGRRAGFAAILGTGTNSCLYDGERITQNIDSLGFILGDEGSGGYLGKRLISDFIRGEMPEKVRQLTATAFGRTGDELIDCIYTQPFPNRFCAQYSRFVGETLHSDPYFFDLVLDSFRAFFHNIVSRYPDYRTYRFNCVGSVGYAFRDILKVVAGEFGMETGSILQVPMEGLIDYHTNRNTTSNP